MWGGLQLAGGFTPYTVSKGHQSQIRVADTTPLSYREGSIQPSHLSRGPRSSIEDTDTETRVICPTADRNPHFGSLL